MISLDEQVLSTMPMKYLANLRGISSTLLSKMSLSTCVKAPTSSFAALIRNGLFESISQIISFREVKESTRFDKSAYFN